jgi:predicted enzyme related to lactoylglutathione lyase
VDVADIKARFDALVEAGATVVQEITDVGGGAQIASVQDADGNIIGLRGQGA